MKRAGDNLARTVDGAQYNKLQRPDTFPEAPPRPVVNRSIPVDASPPSIENEEYGSVNSTPEDASTRRPSHTPPVRLQWKSKRDAAPKGAFFPDLDEYNTGGSSDDDEEHREAMKYLRQVRSQASELPAVVRAKSPVPDNHNPDIEFYNDGIGDSRGYFSEGTYIAAPPIGTLLARDEDCLSDDDDFAQVLSMSPQEAYTTRILTIFERQRNILRLTKPARNNPLLKLRYSDRINHYDPWPAAIVAMSTITTFAMLVHVTKQLKKRQNISPRMSAWTMSILAKMDEKLMDGDSIYLVRELSKKAMWVRFSFDERFADLTAAAEYDHDSQMDGLDEHGNDGGQIRGRQSTKDERPRRRNSSSLSSYKASRPVDDSKPSIQEASPPNTAQARLSQSLAQKPIAESNMNDALLPTAAEARLGTAAAVESARVRLLEKIEQEVENKSPVEENKDGNSTVPDCNTIATIDMIITIVGEVYGQKDLLEGRIDWIHLDSEDYDKGDIETNGEA
ncbi:hypothetical protein FKW77_009637 [Venturia effusa]|uniref:Uncharacterized protein n=1 Tax=Venturia effusa TaxID=50376 RepID=A0A517KXD4_9PEZI|nr:hypothetical protein FKW77_009637 [Venturia effusa]